MVLQLPTIIISLRSTTAMYCLRKLVSTEKTLENVESLDLAITGNRRISVQRGAGREDLFSAGRKHFRR